VRRDHLVKLATAARAEERGELGALDDAVVVGVDHLDDLRASQPTAGSAVDQLPVARIVDQLLEKNSTCPVARQLGRANRGDVGDQRAGPIGSSTA
jgi:hypothetical protein